MKKLILLIALSVLLFSAPGYAGKSRGGTKVAAEKSAKLRSEGFIFREDGALKYAKEKAEAAAAQQLIRRTLAKSPDIPEEELQARNAEWQAKRDVMIAKDIQRKIEESGELPTLEEATKQHQEAEVAADDAQETSYCIHRKMDVAAESEASQSNALQLIKFFENAEKRYLETAQAERFAEIMLEIIRNASSDEGETLAGIAAARVVQAEEEAAKAKVAVVQTEEEAAKARKAAEKKARKAAVERWLKTLEEEAAAEEEAEQKSPQQAAAAEPGQEAPAE